MAATFRIERTGRIFEPPAKLGRIPYVMGILNVSEDSFSDAASYLNLDKALAHAERMISEGADIIDVGAESTRPGASAVDPEIEIKRLVPVIRALHAKFPEIVISVDTRKSSVADAVLKEGADMINDVSGLAYDPKMAAVAAAHRAGLCIMHMRGIPGNMQASENLVYNDLIREVSGFLLNAREKAVSAGVAPDSIMLDPGIGFSKTAEQNVELIHSAEKFLNLGSPVLYGVSRKSFIGKMIQREIPTDRDFGTAGVLGYLTSKNVDFVRVHNVRAAVDVMKMFLICSKQNETV